VLRPDRKRSRRQRAHRKRRRNDELPQAVMVRAFEWFSMMTFPPASSSPPRSTLNAPAVCSRSAFVNAKPRASLSTSMFSSSQVVSLMRLVSPDVAERHTFDLPDRVARDGRVPRLRLGSLAIEVEAHWSETRVPAVRALAIGVGTSGRSSRPEGNQASSTEQRLGPFQIKGARMAKKTIRISDVSGAEIPDGKGAVVRITFADARKGVRELDMTDAEAEKLGGRHTARRGRRPKSAQTG
jgi:hypothetical protein